MTTVTIRSADVLSAQKGLEILARPNSVAASPGQTTRKPFTERHGHEEWTQRIEGDWQNQLETLQRYVGELARRNQQLRRALVMASEPKRGYGNAINL